MFSWWNLGRSSSGTQLSSFFLGNSLLYLYVRLKQIPILRRHISQLHLLVLRKSDIHRSPIPLSIRLPASETIDNACDDAQNGESEADAVSCQIFRGIGSNESEGGYNTACISEADLKQGLANVRHRKTPLARFSTHLPRASNTTPMVASKIHIEPTNHYGHGCIGTHCNEE